MLAEDFLKALAVRFAYAEQRHNGINGMTACLFVLRNRTIYYKRSWLEELEQAYLHSDRNSLSIIPDPRDPSITHMMQVVDKIFDGTAIDRLTGEATSYADVKYETTGEITAKVGSTWYYKL